jgi:hypothetical protein
MFERIMLAYRHLATPVSIRKAARLEVLTLEERATPAVDLLTPVAAPEVITVAPAPKSAEPIVRTDLFGAGVSQSVEPAQPWHLWWSGVDTADDRVEVEVEANEEAAAETAAVVEFIEAAHA